MSYFRPMKRQKCTGGAGIIRIDADGNIVCGRKHKAASWRELLKAAQGKARAEKSRQKKKDEEEAAAQAEEDADGQSEAPGEDDDDLDQMGKFAEYFNGKLDHMFNPMLDLQKDVDDDGEYQDDDFLPDTKKSIKVPSERVRRRKVARHIAMQHTLRKCHNQKLHVINALGRIAVYQRSVIILCTHCLRPLPLLQAIDSNLDKICSECHNKEREVIMAKVRCEALVCQNKVLQPADVCRLTVYDDLAADPEKHCFRTVTLCRAHASFQWIKAVGTVLCASYLFKGLSANWGTYKGPNNSYVPVIPEDEF
jgi:hypothetical protein